MANHNVNPVREQLRGEILAALANTHAPMTTQAIYQACPSAVDAEDVSRLAWELKKKGLIADGGKVDHPRGLPANSYTLARSEDPRLEASKPIQVEPKIKKNRQPAVKRKPALGHPFAAPISPQAPQDRVARVTRDLPMHLRSTAPQMAAKSFSEHIEEQIMSGDPLHYIDPDPFSLQPRDPEAEEDVDSDLVDALLELAHQKVIVDALLELAHQKVIEADTADELLEKMVPLPVAEDDDVLASAAMVKKNREPLIADHANKGCQCLNSLPPLPRGYRYASVVASIFSDEDGETLEVHVVEEGGSPFVKIYATGGLSFDLGELSQIGRVADAFVKLLKDGQDDR